MIDLHCHILPHVDDGPTNLIQFFEMAHAAESAGVTHIVATPHHLNGQYENVKADILPICRQYNDYLQQENISITIHPGQELRIHRELLHSLEIGDILTLDNKGKFLLLELPPNEVPEYTQEMIYELLLKGITPIIAHPERNRALIDNNHILFELVSEGALAQLTAGSIIGQFGKKIKVFAEKMIDHHLAHFVASDAHNCHSRGFSLHEAYEEMTTLFGSQQVMYFKKNAEAILIGQTIPRKQPIPMRRKLFGAFIS